jgi:succinate dehydrogenase / fumarate reductase, cytochrome b subunit
VRAPLRGAGRQSAIRARSLLQWTATRRRFDTRTLEPLNKIRPKYLDLTEIKLPIPAFVSILHRVSGVGLYLVGIPLGLYWFQMSLASEQGYEQFGAIADHWFVKLIFLGLLWAFLHHFCAGIRFLTLDLHMGEALERARSSSVAVLVVSLLLTVILGVQLW